MTAIVRHDRDQAAYRPVDDVTRDVALRRIAAEVSGRTDLATLFEDVIGYSTALFAADRAGLWLLEGHERAFSLKAHHGLSADLRAGVAQLTIESPTHGARAVRERRVTVVQDPAPIGSSDEVVAAYRRDGIHSIVFVPIVFRDEPLGLLVLYHNDLRPWPEEQLDVARAFADQIASAIENARLHKATLDLAARLQAIQELSARLNRIQTVQGIGEAIVAGARDLIEYDNIRIYQVDHAAGECRAIAFQGIFVGMDQPTLEMLGVRLGEGLTGWTALHNTAVRLGDAGSDPRIVRMAPADGPESMLLVPMAYDDRVEGVIVLSKVGRDRFTAEDETTLSIFAGHAAQALANAISAQQVRRQQEELEHRLASQRRLLEVNEQLLSRLDSGEVLETIADSLKTVVDYGSLIIWRIDPIAKVRHAVVVREESEELAEAIRRHVPPVDAGLTGLSMQRNEPILSNDAHLDERALQIPDTLDIEESIVVVPLSIGGAVIGCLQVSRAGEHERFTANEFELTQLFAGQASIALQNAEHAQRVQRQQDELERRLASQRRLLDVNETLFSSLDSQRVLEMIADSLKAVVSYHRLHIYRVDREAGVRRAVVSRGPGASSLAPERPLGIGLTGWVIDHNTAVLANDAHLDTRTNHVPGTADEAESMIVVPLGMGGDVIGTLNISRIGEDGAHFSADEFELTKLFAAQASIALQNADAHRAVEVRAELDSLTRLGNHGAFQRQLAEAVHGGGEMSVMMLDLDRFKSFNDRFGHPAGDTLLQAASAAIAGAIRDSDRAFRYGGDEFAVILPRASRQQAQRVGTRIRQAVAEATRHVADELRGDAPAGPPITVTVGAAVFPDDGSTPDALVAAADEALYLAKPSHHERGAAADGAIPRDAYLAALNETAVALMDRLSPNEMLEAIVTRAADLMATPDGYLYLVEPETGDLVVEVGIGVYGGYLGWRMRPGTGLAGRVLESREAMAIDDYDVFDGRDPAFPLGTAHAVVGIPLVASGNVVGVLGLTARDAERRFGPAEVAVLRRFGQLASLALDNARLFERTRREVAERTRAEEALRSSEDRYRRLSDATSEALAIHRDRELLEVNSAFCRLFGREAADCIGRSILEFAAPETLAALPSIEMPMGVALELSAKSSDGTVFPVEATWREVMFPDGAAHLVSIRDLRETRRLEQELNRSAFYDTVTGLPNRSLLVDRIDHALSWVRPEDPDPIAVILLDVDRFNVINETLGHAVGDQLLAEIGHRLSSAVRPGDTVARIGGDEFAVLLDSVTDVGQARRFAERMEAELAAPFQVGDRDAYLTASMGLALGISGETARGDLLRDAEVALHRAKADASRSLAVYEPSMTGERAERLELEADLRHALERGELVLNYQPLVDLRTGRVAGLEALVRWQHPTRGLVPPLAFIPLAEETGLIVPLGRWVLTTACRQARAWQLAHPSERPIVLSVNLSAREFAQPDLVADVTAILAETGLAPSCLELEITESVLMDDSEAGVEVLRRLRELGVRLVLDDFGTGYSSLAYLKHLPIDTIKIDRSFITDLADSTPDPAIVQAVVALAHGLGMDVVAEGIETAEQLAVLRDLDCDRGQGFHFSRPLPVDRVPALLDGGDRRIGPSPSSVAGGSRVVARARNVAPGASRRAPRSATGLHAGAGIRQAS